MSLMGDAIEKAMSALDKAEKQFTSYAEHHRAKGADDKAATNYGYATMCGDAMEHLKLATGSEGQLWPIDLSKSEHDGT